MRLHSSIFRYLCLFAGLYGANSATAQIPELESLTLRERVGQLICVRVPSNLNAKQQRKFVNATIDNKIGGVCFFAGTGSSQAALTQRLQSETTIPIMVCIDGETGVGMRLTDVPKFPQQMLMGAMPPDADTLILAMGDIVGRQCRQMGIHVNFAPVADLNTNPLNPVIGSRSFGEDKERVSHKAALYAEGIQRQGVMAVAKHFPGHGDTRNDSHLTLPLDSHTAAYIDTVNLYPFRQMMARGIGGIMVAHLHVPALCHANAAGSVPPITSLSHEVVADLLRDSLRFDGLVFTDGLDMKAITNYYSDGTAALMALEAGCDVLLLPDDPDDAIDAICDAAEDNPELRDAIDIHCRRILDAKRHLYHQKEKANADKLRQLADYDNIAYSMALNAATLLHDDGTLTLAATEPDSVTTVKLGKWNIEETQALLDTIDSRRPLLFTLYDTPYTLNRLAALDTIKNPYALVVAYSNATYAHRAVDTLLAHVANDNTDSDNIFRGSLPVSAGGYPCGASTTVHKKTQRDTCLLCRTHPDICAAIDSIAATGIAQRAYPGCQILVARKGSVVFNRCYGTYTYDAASPKVTPTTLYDLASVTKVAATTLSVMRLVDEGRVHLDDKMSKYLPYLRHTNHSHITLREVLSHHARLKATDAFWRGYDLATDTLADHSDAVLKGIAKSKRIKERNKYLYSDLGFILLGDLVHRISGVPLDVYADSCFYRPLGLTHTTFNPLLHGFDKSQIAPTEYDTVLRGGYVCGTVHDPNAAAMGGVAGHAGLFSTADDLARLLMLLLGEGDNAADYLSADIINTFNRRYYQNYGNRRALGFDKPLFSPHSNGNTAVSVSQSSFGHTGFTGTMFWVDPKNDMVYVFLSNRVCPDTHPNRLSDLNIRTDIQELLYYEE